MGTNVRLWNIAYDSIGELYDRAFEFAESNDLKHSDVLHVLKRFDLEDGWRDYVEESVDGWSE